MARNVAECRRVAKGCEMLRRMDLKVSHIFAIKSRVPNQTKRSSILPGFECAQTEPIMNAWNYARGVLVGFFLSAALSVLAAGGPSNSPPVAVDDYVTVSNGIS